jgi:kynurenine 3-monooxygenase
MIHHADSTLDSQLYDRDGQVRIFLHSGFFFFSIGCTADSRSKFVSPQCINSIDRALLNESLLEEASASPNVQIFFQHKVQFVDFDKKNMTVMDVAGGGATHLVDFDFCVGADGSYSVIRRQMMKAVRHVQRFF